MNIRHIAAACGFALIASSALAHGTLEGHTFDIQYGLLTDAGWQTLSSRNVTAGTGLEVSKWSLSKTKDISWNIDFSGANIAFTYVGVDDFMNVGTFTFQGFRIFDTTASAPVIEDLLVTNTTYVPNVQGNLIEGFDPATAATFTDHSVSVNLTESMYHHHAMTGMGDPVRDAIKLHVSLADVVSPGPVGTVPEPSTWALLMAGVTVIGWRGMRRRQA